MYSHPITKDLNTWWGKHGADHKSEQWHNYIKNLSELVSSKMDKILQEHTNDGKFGMSGAGRCTREVALKQLGYKREEFDATALMTFHIGHLLESVPIATLRAMGYRVEGLQEPVRIEPYMQSYTDGIITQGLRLDIDYPCVLSVKTTGYKFSRYNRNVSKIVRQGFASLPFDGVRESNPSWYVQSQTEMLATGIDQSLVIVVAKDIVQAMKDDPYLAESGSMVFYAELIKADKKVQEEIKNTWGEMWEQVKAKPAPQDIPAIVWRNKFITIPEPGSKGSERSIWGGINQTVFPFNPCGNCGFKEVCSGD